MAFHGHAIRTWVSTSSAAMLCPSLSRTFKKTLPSVLERMIQLIPVPDDDKVKDRSADPRQRALAFRRDVRH